MKKLRIYESPDGKIVVVNNNNEIIFEVYKGGNATPGGENESYNQSVEQLTALIKKLKMSGYDVNTFKSGKDFQNALYDLSLKSPEGKKSVENMWSKYGMTLHGVNDPNVRKYLESKGVNLENANRGYKLDFSNIKEEDKLEVFSYLKDKGYVDGKVGVRTLSLNPELSVSANEPKKEVPVVKDKGDESKPEDYVPNWDDINNERKSMDGMWLQDRINIAGAFTDNVNKYKPFMSKVNFNTPDYSLLDPSRGIANFQSQMSNNKDMIMNNALLPNLGVSAALALNASDSNKIADYISNIENQNVQIANQSAINNANIENDEILKNEGFKQIYNVQAATLEQQYDNAVRDLKWKRLNAINDGLNNYQQKKSLEAIFPQIWQNPLTYDIDIVNGKNPISSTFDPLSAYYQLSRSSKEQK